LGVWRGGGERVLGVENIEGNAEIFHIFFKECFLENANDKLMFMIYIFLILKIL